MISYECANESELIADFHAAVDKYLELCDKEGQAPEAVYGTSHIDIMRLLLQKQKFRQAANCLMPKQRLGS